MFILVPYVFGTSGGKRGVAKAMRGLTRTLRPYREIRMASCKLARRENIDPLKRMKRKQILVAREQN